MRPKNELSGQKSRSFIEEARRAQIVDSAIEVIAELGYARASLARIAEHAGISKGVISYHFAGKNELMEQVVIQIYTGIQEHVTTAIDGIEQAGEMLRALILAVAERMREHRTQLRALGEIFNNLRDDAGRPLFGPNAAEEIYQSLESLYRLGQETGEFRPFDIRVMALTHLAATDAMFAYWVANPGHDLDAHARELADLFERAVT